jgi:CheY-like chemotaxis protein
MVEPRVLCVADRVRATEKMLARLLGEDVRLVTRFAAEAWLVQVDPGQLDQVILNFAVNARDAMPEGGKLLVATKNITLTESKSSSLFSIPAGDYLMLEISDEGIGMDAETGSRLFEPFFTTKAHGKGTGLGLATCYGIMLQAGGAIFFQTEIGRGTTFHLYFPRVLDMPLSLPPQSGRTALRGRGERVLVVEDEARVRAVTVQILEGVGYVVLQAGGMDEALRVVRETTEEIALLITDVVLSDGSGRETAGEIADMRPDIGVLYVSGYTDDSILRHGIFEKGIEFLAKPFTPSELAARVRQVIDRNGPRGGLVDARNG